MLKSKAGNAELGSHPKIDIDKFPKQGDFPSVGSKVVVCFNYDSSRQIEGTVIRNDVEEPGEMIIHLDDNRVVRSVECMWKPK